MGKLLLRERERVRFEAKVNCNQRLFLYTSGDLLITGLTIHSLKDFLENLALCYSNIGGYGCGV